MASGEGVTASATGPKRQPRKLAAMLRSQMRNIAPFLTLICLSAFFAVASPSFATLDNVGNILTQVSVTGIIAVGLTFVILCAEIDLSIASIANVTGIAVAYFTQQESYVNIANIPLPGWAAILLALLLCALLGLVNALGLTIIGIPSFIMTLAMMQIAAGISALLVRGQIAYKVPDLITALGSSSIGGIPWIVIVAALMLLGGHLVLTYTRFGRYVYMVGGNREAAEYSGLNVSLILGSVMVIAAVCSGIGGMLGVAHFGSAQQNEFDTYLLDSIAAVVVGGTSLFGGRGGIGNTIVGLFVLGVLNNGLDHVNIDSFLKILIRGLILLAALVINVYAQRLNSSFPHGRSGCQSRNSRAAFVTARMVPNDRVSTSIARASRRLRASQIAWARPRMRRMIFAPANPTMSWNRRAI
jgi:ribose transport system permease protein